MVVRWEDEASWQQAADQDTAAQIWARNLPSSVVGLVSRLALQMLVLEPQSVPWGPRHRWPLLEGLAATALEALAATASSQAAASSTAVLDVPQLVAAKIP